MTATGQFLLALDNPRNDLRRTGPRQPGARLLLRDGLPIATLVSGEFKPLVALTPADEHAARMTLLRDPGAHSHPALAPGSRPMADPLGLHR